MTVIQTHGRFIKEVLGLFDPLTDESIFNFTKTEASSLVVNESNTASGQLTIPASAFDQYNFSADKRLGIQLTAWDSALSYARKKANGGDGDPVKVALGDDKATIVVTREEEHARRESTVFHLDPESMRRVPDPMSPSHNLTNTAAFLDVDAFADATEAIADHHDTVMLSAKDGALKMRPNDGKEHSKGTQVEDTFSFDQAAEPWAPGDEVEEGFLEGRNHTAPGSLVNTDFLQDAARAASKYEMDRLVAYVGETSPIWLRYHDAETGVEVEYAIAPRIPDADS